MSTSVNLLELILTQQDSSGTDILNRDVGPVSYSGIVGVFTNGVFADTNSHAQTLPTATVLQFYFKNTHSSANVTVTWTLQGGSSEPVLKVAPGQVVAFWSPVTSGTAGITALTLQSDTLNSTYEMFLGG